MIQRVSKVAFMLGGKKKKTTSNNAPTCMLTMVGVDHFLRKSTNFYIVLTSKTNLDEANMILSSVFEAKIGRQ